MLLLLDQRAELRRLVRLARAYRIMTEGDDAVAAGRMDEALRLYSAAEEMEPDNHEFVFWHAVGLASTGRVEDSLPVFRRAFLAHPAWVWLVPIALLQLAITAVGVVMA